MSQSERGRRGALLTSGLACVGGCRREVFESDRFILDLHVFTIRGQQPQRETIIMVWNRGFSIRREFKQRRQLYWVLLIYIPIFLIGQHVLRSAVYVPPVEPEVYGDFDPYNGTSQAPLFGKSHPIPRLMESAKKEFEKRSIHSEKYKDLAYAREDYKRRYNLEPPRGFDRWHSYMVSQRSKEAVNLIDFDAMMENLLPFRAIHPKELRRRLWAVNKNLNRRLVTYKILNGVRMNGTVEEGDKWVLEIMDKYLDTVIAAAGPGELKNIEILYNYLDEPRSLVRYEVVDKYHQAARSKKHEAKKDDPTPDPVWFFGESTDEWGKYEGKQLDQPRPVEMTTLWRKTRDTCPPDSPSRHGAIDPMAGHYFPWVKPAWKYAPLPFTVGGFIKNFSQSLDICVQNDMQSYHGMTLRPSTTSVVTNDLFPIMSGCSMSGYNDILVPGAVFHFNQFVTTKKRVDWRKKIPQMMWRGSSTGAYTVNADWRGTQRGRMVCRVNRRDRSTESVLVDTSFGIRSVNIPTEKLDRMADVAISNIFWVDPRSQDSMRATPCFRMTQNVPFDVLPEYRYLLDVDGNSFSSRFPELLRMGGTVLKSQIVYEWFTSSIVPWYHYVPMNIRFSDTYDIITWFEGFKSLFSQRGPDIELKEAVRMLDARGDAGREAAERAVALAARPHLEEAETIGERGMEFAAGNLRQVDTVVFFYRVLIEWEEMLDIGGEGGGPCDFGCQYKDLF
ncbi:capsule-associated protein CAP1 [Planoprotostelium fungivorum]|uniref:Capsule-associated protein CAP1 n=1 Tax=Planoprotostelium fungivorum TaxID=1890364 RepID=A0A2P6MRU2_9EUKA|nr:capsule-associated protein CAP1 [Planoprotostelium fungivorum]